MAPSAISNFSFLEMVDIRFTIIPIWGLIEVKECEKIDKNKMMLRKLKTVQILGAMCS
jgi:hypothetical protein